MLHHYFLGMRSAVFKGKPLPGRNKLDQGVNANDGGVNID